MKIKKNIYIILFGLVLFLGIFLRSYRLYTTPHFGSTFDEFAWTWQGMNIIQHGVPTSWSPHALYKNYKIVKYKGAYFRLVTPYLEHPPAFGIVAGSYAIFNGATGMFDVDLKTIRGLALILGSLSIIGVYLLASKLYDKKIGLISSFLYAIVPTIVIGSRIVQNENFFIPLWLFALYLTAVNIKKKSKLVLISICLLCALMVLSKIPFVAGGVSIIGIFLYFKKYKYALAVFSSILGGFLIYAIYGLYLDHNLFINLLRFQSQRYDIVFNSVYALFQKPYLVDSFYTDGWIFWGWISFFLLLVKDFKKNAILIIALLSYFIIFVAGIPDEPGHGWYRYPFYPFLIISIALFLKEYFMKNLLITFVFLIFVGLSLLQSTWLVAFGFSFIIMRFFIVASSITALPLLFPTKKIYTISSMVGYSMLAMYFISSICAILIYNEQ